MPFEYDCMWGSGEAGGTVSDLRPLGNENVGAGVDDLEIKSFARDCRRATCFACLLCENPLAGAVGVTCSGS